MQIVNLYFQKVIILKRAVSGFAVICFACFALRLRDDDTSESEAIPARLVCRIECVASAAAVCFKCNKKKLKLNIYKNDIFRIDIYPVYVYHII